MTRLFPSACTHNAATTLTVPMEVLRPSIEHAAKEIATRQIKAVSDANRRYLGKTIDTEALGAWADKWFTGHLKVMRQKLKPLWRGCEEAIGKRLEVSPEEMAESFGHALGTFIPDVKVVILDEGDPADMSESEAMKMKYQLFGGV